MGGVRAVNALDIEIMGVAGTSAGAIVAALLAVGYTGMYLTQPRIVAGIEFA